MRSYLVSLTQLNVLHEGGVGGGGVGGGEERKEKITIIYDVAKMLRLNISQGLGGCPERLFPWGVFVMEGV